MAMGGWKENQLKIPGWSISIWKCKAMDFMLTFGEICQSSFIAHLTSAKPSDLDVITVMGRGVRVVSADVVTEEEAQKLYRGYVDSEETRVWGVKFTKGGRLSAEEVLTFLFKHAFKMAPSKSQRIGTFFSFF